MPERVTSRFCQRRGGPMLNMILLVMALFVVVALYLRVKVWDEEHDLTRTSGVTRSLQ